MSPQESIQVQISFRTCGICGDSNNNRADDFLNRFEGKVAECTEYKTRRAKRMCRSLDVAETWAVEAEENMPGYAFYTYIISMKIIEEYIMYIREKFKAQGKALT